MNETTNEQRSYDAVLADAVRLLTEAARRVITWSDSDRRERREAADFAEFLTQAVAGAAANIGGIERVLAGRPGSWEASCVREMLHSTVGHDEAHLFEHRTEPVVVRVYVDDILNDLGWWALYDEAHDELNRREDAIHNRHDSDELLEDYDADDQAALDELDRLRDALDEQREQECVAYGQAFRGNVHRAAAELFATLAVPVEVVIETGWQNDLGTGADWDGPVSRIWDAAFRSTPLPGSGIPLNDYPRGVDVAQVERDAGRTPLARLGNRGGQR